MSLATVDLVVRGGTIVSSTGAMSAGIAVDGGVIVAIARDDALPEARETIDAAGKYVLPGVIDPHVHFRSPGYEYKEDWTSGTAAAACGCRATRPVFLVFVAGGAEVDVGIDDSGEHVLPGGVDRLASLGKRVVACDGHDHAAIDGDAGAHGSGGRDDRPAPYHEIHGRETHSGVSWRVIRTAGGVSRGA